MDTKKKLYEIEIALAKSREFDFSQKLVVFNVLGEGSILPIRHECDVLVCSNAGYLSEIEIKRSYSDFMCDFKKRHDHQSKYIKNFYYCVPFNIKDKVVDFLDNFENRDDWRTKAGIIVFHEDSDWISVKRVPKPNKECVKITTEQKLYLAKLGSMRVMNLKRKILKLEKLIDFLNEEIEDNKLEIKTE